MISKRLTLNALAPQLLTGAILLFLLACSSVQLPGQSPQSGSPIDAEARAEAERFWHSQMTRCGDSYYRRMALPRTGEEAYHQLRDPQVRLLPQRVTEADRLNGIEWQGTTSLQPQASRVWGADIGRWRQWEDGARGVPDLNRGLRKVNGEWSISPVLGERNGILRYEAPDCASIPPG